MHEGLLRPGSAALIMTQREYLQVTTENRVEEIRAYGEQRVREVERERDSRIAALRRTR